MAIIKTTITKIKHYYCYDIGLRQDKMIFENPISIPNRNDDGIRYDRFSNEGMIFNDKYFVNLKLKEVDDGETYFLVVYQTENKYVEVLDVQPFMQVKKTDLGITTLYWCIKNNRWSGNTSPKYKIKDRAEDYDKVDA